MRLNRRGLGTGHARSRIGLSVALLLLIAAIAFDLGSGAWLARVAAGAAAAQPPVFAAASMAPSVSVPQVRAAFDHLPLIFEPNQGQSDARVKFLARGNGYGLFLTRDEAVLALRASLASPASGRDGGNRKSPAKRDSVVRMGLANANPGSAVNGTDQLPGKSHYFIGNDPARWHRNVPQFGRVRYQDVYPGIDLVYYGSRGRLEYDFEVSPNANPGQIALRFQGQEKLDLQPNGDLRLATSGGDLLLQAPRVYQEVGNEQRTVPGRFVLVSQDEVGFELGTYDRSRALIIDPVLSYSSYLGGSGDEACSVPGIVGSVTAGCPAITVDTALNVYVAGSTTSPDFPIVPVDTCPPANHPAAFQCTNAGNADVFVTKFTPVSSNPPYAVAFSTYLGGDGIDTSAGVAVDSSFDVDVAGTTDSTNFPTVGGFQAPPVSAGKHVFVSRLETDGSALLYSTYLASNTGADRATGLAVDQTGKIYVTGTTTSPSFPTSGGFPTTPGAFQLAPLAANALFISKLDPKLAGAASLLYSTYFGGGNPANGSISGGGIAVETTKNTNGVFNLYITGATNFLHVGDSSTDFPLLNAFQVCLDDPTNPTTCPTNVTANDIFVAKFNPSGATGAQLLYSTYLGGSGDDVGTGIAVDSIPNVYLTGKTTSTDFGFTPGTGVTTFQKLLNCPGTTKPTPCPLPDAFLAKLGVPCTGTTCTTTNVPLNYFTYLGGSGADAGFAVAVDNIQGARITGTTASSDLPVTANAFQPTPGGGVDAFVARIDTTATTNLAPGHSLSYLGGSGNDAGTSIATDVQPGTVSQGAVYVAGETFSGNFPTTNPLQAALNGTSDAFVSKVGPRVNLAFSPKSTASPSPVGVGNQLTFTYTIVNNGDQLSNVTFHSAVPAGATFVSANLGTGTNTCTGGSTGTVVCNIATFNSGATATANIIVTPTPPTTSNAAPVMLPDTAQVSVAGGNPTTDNVTATVNDFTLNSPPPAPATATVVAGKVATYQITVTPTGPIPSSVTLACSGLPTGATCHFTTATIPNLNNGSAVSDTLNIDTTLRTTTTVDLRPGGGPVYAVWLPVSGLALLGLRIGGKMSGRRRLLGGIMLAAMFAMAAFQAGCGSSNTAKTIVQGTPAGSYPIIINATSGATRSSSVMLNVQ